MKHKTALSSYIYVYVFGFIQSGLTKSMHPALRLFVKLEVKMLVI